MLNCLNKSFDDVGKYSAKKVHLHKKNVDQYIELLVDLYKTNASQYIELLVELHKKNWKDQDVD
jgi:hypothetical protein